MARKYQSYEIKVAYQNGDMEEISILNEKEVDKTSYKEMMHFYNEIKDQYKDKNCNIEFCGSSENGTLDIMFTKVWKSQETDIIKNDVSVDISLKEMNNIIGRIKERSMFIEGMLSVYTKKQDFLLHKIEILDEMDLKNQTDSIVNEIKNIRLKRRDLKNERKIFECMKTLDFEGNLNKILNIISDLHMDKKVDLAEKNTEQAKAIYSEPLEENKLIKEIKFRTQKERVCLMAQLKPKYDRVVVDDLKFIITCFNNCGSAKNRKILAEANK